MFGSIVVCAMASGNGKVVVAVGEVVVVIAAAVRCWCCGDDVAATEVRQTSAKVKFRRGKSRFRARIASE